jgi:hypothetical protein
MIVITLEYKPYGFFGKKRFNKELPARWAEMTPNQLAVIPDMRRGILDETKLLNIFLGIRKSLIKRIDSYQRYCILKELQFINKPEAYEKFIISKILWYKAPAPFLKDITFGAFMFGDTYYQNYLSGTTGDLNRFIACFYYDKKGFNEKYIEDNAFKIGLIDLKTREAIAINYALIREWLAKAYPFVFEQGHIRYKAEKSRGWVGVFDAIVADDISNSEKYAEKPLSTILRYLNRKTKEYYKHGSNV